MHSPPIIPYAYPMRIKTRAQPNVEHVFHDEYEEQEEEDLDDTLKELPGGVCPDGDETTDTDPRDFFISSTIVESATITYKMTEIGKQATVELPVDKPEPNICHRQLLRSNGGITLPEEITLSILGFLKSADQVRSLTAFQQCSKSCYDLAYPLIWEDELVVSMRGMNIIRQTWDFSLTGIAFSPTPGLVRLWSSLYRVKKMRIVEIGRLHVANVTAGVMPPTLKGVKPSNVFVHSAPYQRLEAVTLTEAAGTQIYRLAHLPETYSYAPVLSRFGTVVSRFDNVPSPKSKAVRRSEAVLWLGLMMRGFYLAFYSPSEPRRPIQNVTFELPNFKWSWDPRHGAYAFAGCDISDSFFRYTSELTECSQNLRLSNMGDRSRRDLKALPRYWAGSELVMTYRPTKPRVTIARAAKISLRNVVSHILQWIETEVAQYSSHVERPPTLSPKIFIHIPLASNAAPRFETLDSLVESGYLTSPMEDWSRARTCAFEMYQIVQHFLAHYDLKLPLGTKSLVSRVCERIHLDLAGMDESKHFANWRKDDDITWRPRNRLRAMKVTPESDSPPRWGSNVDHWEEVDYYVL